MSEKLESGGNGDNSTEQFGSEWDIFTEKQNDDDLKNPAEESPYEFQPQEMPDGATMETTYSVGEDQLRGASQEIYVADAYDGPRDFQGMEDVSLRSAITDVLNRRDQLANENSSPMQVLCRLRNTNPGSAYPEYESASGIHDSQLEILIESGVDGRTDPGEILELRHYITNEMEVIDRSKGLLSGSDIERRHDREKTLDDQIRKTILEHAGEDFFLKEGSERVLNDLTMNLSAREKIAYFTEIQKKFNLGPSASAMIGMLLQASSPTVYDANPLNGESVFESPSSASTLEGGMSEAVKTGVVEAMIRDDSMEAVVAGLSQEQLVALARIVNERMQSESQDSAAL